MNNAHMMISRLMMEDALHFSAIMNYRHQCSWMSRPSCFIHSLFFPVIFHPRSFWGSLAHYISSMKVGSFICPPLIRTHSCLVHHISSPLFFWVLPVIFLPRFFFSCPSYVIRFFLGSSCLSYFIHESLFIHLSAAHCTHSCLVRHISSTKVCSFVCPPLIPAPGTHLRVRVCVRVASCAFSSDGGRCRHIRVFSSGSVPSKKLLICAFSCCFSLEDVVKLSA